MKATCKIIAVLAALAAVPALARPGDTTVLRWEGGARACFLLMFDDGWPSAWQVAMPELARRGLAATYYIVPQKGEYKVFEKKWIEHACDPGVLYGNHTMHHSEVRDYEHAKSEIGGVCDYIRSVQTNRAHKLVSWAQPGLKPGCWAISKEDFARIEREYRLVSRPDFKDHGAVYHLQTCEQMMKLVDKALAEGGMEYVIFHGLEIKDPKRGWQDFWAMKQDVCFPFFDNLAELRRKGDLWVTDHISCHQYDTERSSARVTAAKTAAGYTVELTSDADPALYDYPLTLETEVPARAKKAKVVQGGRPPVVVPVADGRIRYPAVPGAGRISIVLK